MNKNTKQAQCFQIINNNINNLRGEIYSDFKYKLDQLRHRTMSASPASYKNMYYNDSLYILNAYTQNYIKRFADTIKENLLRLNSNFTNEEWMEIENSIVRCGLWLIIEFDNRFKNDFRDSADHRLLVNTLQKDTDKYVRNSINELKAIIYESYNAAQIHKAKKANFKSTVSLIISIISLIVTLILNIISLKFT